MVMNPNDEIVVPVIVEYKLNSNYKNIKKSIAFDIRTSLYKDPLHYAVVIAANYESTPQDKLVGSLVKNYKPTVIKTKQYQTVVS